jgi:hypothetical protein
MSDSLEALRSRAKIGGGVARPSVEPVLVEEPGSDEDCCQAFGFRRGISDRALTIEFRLANGNSRAYPYSWLGEMTLNRSAGLLIQFVGEMVHFVLIEGTNLNATVNGGVSLFDTGLLRQRITWVREMSRAEAGRAKPGEVVIDRIRIASQRPDDDAKDIAWLEPFKLSEEE